MRILMLASHFLPHLGGVEKHVLRVSQELLRLGHSVTVLTRRWDPAWPQEQDWQGIRVHRVAGGIARAAADRHLDLFREAQAAHCHDLYPYLRFVAPVWPMVRVPLFVTFHGYERYPVPRTARYLRRRLAARAAGTICMGEFVCRWYGHPCDYISYGGVDAPAVRAPAAEPDAPAVYVGRLAPDTGIMAYLETLRLLRQRGRDLGLIVCGDGPLRDAIYDFACEHDIDLTMRGWVSDIASCLDECRFAFVSGYLSILEAMANRRLACAVYDNPLKRDYLQLFPGAQHMLIADSPRALASAIEPYLLDPGLAGPRLDAAEDFARQQTWARVAALYLNLYRKQGLVS